MKKRKKTIPWGVLAGCGLAFVLYAVLANRMGDHTAPEITVPETTLQISVHEEEESLKQGITALDDKDGDVTELMVVESVSHIDDGNEAVVTYAAFDRSGNVSKAQRTVAYTDYVGPRFTLAEPLIFREGSRFDVFETVGAVDQIDGDLSDRVKGTLVSGQLAVDRAGMYEVEFRVSNSLGDTAHLRVPIEVTAFSDAQRRLELTHYVVYLKKGDDFAPISYLTGESRNHLNSVESDVNTEIPGTYAVTYTDQNGKSYGKTRLVVVVEE